MFETNTYEAVLTRLLGRIKSSISKIEGTITYSNQSALAVEFADVYTNLDRILTLAFKPVEDRLDQRADEYGLTRKPATFAIGNVKVTGAEGTVIPKGSFFATLNGTLFVTAADAAIPAGGNIDVPVQADKAGAVGNVPIGQITQVPVSIAGVTSVTNEAATQGGFEKETDDELWKRVLEKGRKPATSGNKNHYKQWALEIAGIGDAKVFPVWNGAGTVKVVILDSNKRAPLAAKVTEVQDYIDPNPGMGEGQSPIGAAVTVAAATETATNVTATLTLAAGKTLANAQAEFTALLGPYLKSLAFVDPVVRYNQIGNMLLDCSSVIDYANLQVNGGTANINIANDAVAVPGAVNFS